MSDNMEKYQLVNALISITKNIYTIAPMVRRLNLPSLIKLMLLECSYKSGILNYACDCPQIILVIFRK